MNTKFLAFTYRRALRRKVRASLALHGPPEVRLNHERVLYLHYPKTGGTSLAVQFDNYLRSGLAHDYEHDPLINPKSSPLKFPRNKKMLLGHFKAVRYAHVDAFWMTFLRHPVDNIMSNYFFWKSLPSHGHRLHEKFLIEGPSLIEFAHYGGIRTLMSEAYFGDFDMGRFDFIGFDETRTDDLARLSGALGVPLTAEEKVNRTPDSAPYEEAKASVACRLALTDALTDDVRFYEGLRR